MNEFENIPYMRVKGIRIFLNEVMYRGPHFHKSVELMFVLSGEMNVNIEHTCLDLAANDMVIINPNSPHEITANGGVCTFLCLQFQPETYQINFPAMLFDGHRPKNYLSESEYGHIKGLLTSMALKYFSGEELYEIYCIAAANYILYTLLTNMPHHVLFQKNNRKELMSARLVRLVDYVEQNYMHRPSLADFAKAENRSLSYISRFVKNALNQSFQSYVNTVRFYAACRMIADGKMSMLDICYEVGFSDYRYFSKVFKERTGLTPSQYQKAEVNTARAMLSYDQEHILSDEDSASLLRRQLEQKELQ